MGGWEGEWRGERGGIISQYLCNTEALGNESYKTYNKIQYQKFPGILKEMFRIFRGWGGGVWHHLVIQ